MKESKIAKAACKAPQQEVPVSNKVTQPCNNINAIEPIKHSYKVVKKNNYDTQYRIQHKLPLGSILKERVKVESYQKFNGSSAMAEYFRIRGNSSWKNGNQITGMWKTHHNNLRYGRYKKQNKIVFFLFITNQKTKALTVYQFPEGFDTNNAEIENLYKSLKSDLL